MSLETLEDVYAMVRDLDANMEVDSPEFKTAVLLASFFVVGPNDERLSVFCKLPAAFVKERMDNLREYGIVKEDEVFKVDWLDEESGGVAFLMDCQVADGLMERDDDHNYKMTPAGIERVKGLLK